MSLLGAIASKVSLLTLGVNDEGFMEIVHVSFNFADFSNGDLFRIFFFHGGSLHGKNGHGHLGAHLRGHPTRAIILNDFVNSILTQNSQGLLFGACYTLIHDSFRSLILQAMLGTVIVSSLSASANKLFCGVVTGR